MSVIYVFPSTRKLLYNPTSERSHDKTTRSQLTGMVYYEIIEHTPFLNLMRKKVHIECYNTIQEHITTDINPSKSYKHLEDPINPCALPLLCAHQGTLIVSTAHTALAAQW